MKNKLIIGLLMAFFPIMLSAQGAGGQVRRTVKKQYIAVEKPSKKKQKAPKKQGQEKPAKQEPVSTPVEAAGYDVTISCNVPSAALYIDDNNYGTASGSRFLKTGSHTIKLNAEGYEPFSQTIQVNSASRLFSFTMTEKENKLPSVIQNLVDNMIYVEGGTFIMGATSEQGNDANDDEKPAHQVTLSSFSIGKYEVTQEEWLAVMGTNPSCFKGDKLPVENISWNECQEFILRLNSMTGLRFRLPTEAEWEYAARGGKKSRGYKYAGSNVITNVAWYDGISSSKTYDVGQRLPNELGLFDMSGNVWEWCNDYFGNYDSLAQTNPRGLSVSTHRVYRGGSWSRNVRMCRVSFRTGSAPSLRFGDLGFRLAL